jgi:hypothetical protein
MTAVVQWLGIISSGGAALLFLRASLIAVPDNIDTFVGELQRAGQWNSAGTAAACISFACQAYLFAVGLGG